MPRTPTTPVQVEGHRFLMRRIEHALVRADAKMLHDPLRTRNRATVVGLVLVLLLGAGTAVLGLLRPQASGVMRSSIITVAESNAMYVQLNEQLHPVANLASARLIVGAAESAQKVKEDAIHNFDMGFPIGIAGAPAVVDQQSVGAVSLGMCDQGHTALHRPMAVVNTVARLGIDESPPGQHTSVVAEFEGDHWVVHDGVRARVNVSDPVVARALGITPDVVRPVSSAFLGAVPEVSAVGVPEIEQRGEFTGFPAPFDQVGAVVEVDGKFVVVVRGGAAEVSTVVGKMLQAVGPHHVASARELGAVPVAKPLDFPGIPAQVPSWNRQDGWICADSYQGETRVVALPSGAQPGAGAIAFPGGHVSEYPSADGAGPEVDGFAGNSAFPTVAVLVEGAPHLLSASGVRHRVESRRALGDLGFRSEVPLPSVPWRVLASLPEGPELTQVAALSPIGSAT